MLDIYTDVTRQCAYFDGHIEMLEVDELAERREKATGDEITRRVQEFAEMFDVQADCSKAELERAARKSVALDGLIKDKELGSMRQRPDQIDELLPTKCCQDQAGRSRWMPCTAAPFPALR